MKKLQFNLLLTLAFNILAISLTAQTPDLDKKTAEVKALHKEKELFLEKDYSIFADSLGISDEIVLPKNKYIIYVIVDSEAIKKATFTMQFEAMKGKMENEDDKNRTSVGKGFNAYKIFTSKPRVIETQVANVEFKINDVSTLSNTMSSYNSGGSTYTKYKNCAPIKFRFDIAQEDFVRNYSRTVKILIYEK